MPTPETLYFLDTNVLVALVRRGELGRTILSRFSLLMTPQTPLISYVTEAEIEVIAARNRWGEPRREQLRFLLTTFRRVSIEDPGVLKAYVEIDLYSGRHQREMGKNDLWIAATAATYDATLLTTDQDFDHLDGVFFRRLYIDPSAPSAPAGSSPE